MLKDNEFRRNNYNHYKIYSKAFTITKNQVIDEIDNRKWNITLDYRYISNLSNDLIKLFDKIQYDKDIRMNDIIFQLEEIGYIEVKR